jgi:methionyl-tRNA synthetase
MTKKYFDGVVPAPVDTGDALDADLSSVVCASRDAFVSAMDDYHIADAIDAVVTLLRRANKYIDETMPWTLAKDEANKARLGTVMYNLLEAIRFASVLLTPIIPTSCEKIFAQLGTSLTGYDSIAKFGTRPAGETVGEAEVLFSRIDEEKTLAEIAAEREAALKAAESAKPERKAEISIDAFGAVELRAAQIVECEGVPKAKKLLRLTVDLGYEKRQVVSGIAKFYKPEELIGKKVVLVCNLKPAKLCGVDSFGMILASGDGDDVRVIFLDDAVENGSEIH